MKAELESSWDCWSHSGVTEASLMTWQTKQNSQQRIAQLISTITQLSATVLNTSFTAIIHAMQVSDIHRESPPFLFTKMHVSW